MPFPDVAIVIVTVASHIPQNHVAANRRILAEYVVFLYVLGIMIMVLGRCVLIGYSDPSARCFRLLCFFLAGGPDVMRHEGRAGARAYHEKFASRVARSASIGTRREAFNIGLVLYLQIALAGCVVYMGICLTTKITCWCVALVHGLVM